MKAAFPNDGSLGGTNGYLSRRPSSSRSVISSLRTRVRARMNLHSLPFLSEDLEERRVFLFLATPRTSLPYPLSSPSSLRPSPTLTRVNENRRKSIAFLHSRGDDEQEFTSTSRTSQAIRLRRRLLAEDCESPLVVQYFFAWSASPSVQRRHVCHSDRVAYSNLDSWQYAPRRSIYIFH